MDNVIHVPLERWKPRPTKPTPDMSISDLKDVIEQIRASYALGAIDSAEAEKRFNEVTQMYKQLKR